MQRADSTSAPPRTAPRVYLLVGTLTGLAFGSVLYSYLDIDSSTVRVTWMIGSAVAGFFFGWLLQRLQSAEVTRSTRRPERPDEGKSSADELQTGGTRQMTFYALPAGGSSSALQSVEVERMSAPMAPPEFRLRLLIENFDHATRVVVTDHDLLRHQTAREVAERAMAAAVEHAPTARHVPRYALTEYRSEGPLESDGRCRFGWTFYFVDGLTGLCCAATVSSREISLQYKTVSWFYEPGEQTHITPGDADEDGQSDDDGWVCPSAALELLREQVPDLADRSLYLRFNLPGDLLLYVNEPLFIADVDVRGGVVRNAAAIKKYLESGDAIVEREKFGLDALQAWFRGDAEGESEEIKAALEDAEFEQGLRTLRPEAIRRAALALYRAEGAGVAHRIERLLDEAVNAEEKRELLFLLSRLPSGLAAACLQRIALDSEDPDLKALASNLFTRRRHNQFDVPPDPIAPLDFEESREAMGKRGLFAIPLLSTYDPEADLLEPLAEIGLKVTRSRILCGESALLLSAYLRPTRGDTEGVITSTPLPMPCHILHLIGSAAEAFSERVERSGLIYSLDEIDADVASGTPYRVHRGALYMAALHRPYEGDIAPLLDVFDRGATDANLRRAILHAVRWIQSEAARRFMKQAMKGDDEEEATLARELYAEMVAERMTDASSSGLRSGSSSRPPSTNASRPPSHPPRRGSASSPPVRRKSDIYQVPARPDSTSGEHATTDPRRSSSAYAVPRD